MKTKLFFTLAISAFSLNAPLMAMENPDAPRRGTTVEEQNQNTVNVCFSLLLGANSQKENFMAILENITEIKNRTPDYTTPSFTNLLSQFRNYVNRSTLDKNIREYLLSELEAIAPEAQNFATNVPVRIKSTSKNNPQIGGQNKGDSPEKKMCPPSFSVVELQQLEAGQEILPLGQNNRFRYRAFDENERKKIHEVIKVASSQSIIIALDENKTKQEKGNICHYQATSSSWFFPQKFNFKIEKLNYNESLTSIIEPNISPMPSPEEKQPETNVPVRIKSTHEKPTITNNQPPVAIMAQPQVPSEPSISSNPVQEQKQHEMGAPVSVDPIQVKPNIINNNQPPIAVMAQPQTPSEPNIFSNPVPERKYPYMDVALGVKFLHDQGLTGEGVNVGVIDVTDTGRDVSGEMKGFKRALVENSDPFNFRQGCHSSHVSGIICGQKIEGKTSVAPKSKVFFKAYFPFITKTHPSIKCNVTALEDWVFVNTLITKGSTVEVHQDGDPEGFYGDIKKLKYFYEGKELEIPEKMKQRNSDYLITSKAHGCTNRGGNPGTNLYPGLVSHYEDIENNVDDHLSTTINSMNEMGIRIINFSVGTVYGPKTLDALRKLAKNGGVFVIAAGNNRGKFSSQGYDLKGYFDIKDLRTNIFATLGDQFPESVIFVGNLNKSYHSSYGKPSFSLNDGSTKAGDMKANYIAAWGTDVPSIIYNVESSSFGWIGVNDYTTITPETKKKRATAQYTGASMAAPMISGIIADLYQGFKNKGCTPLQIKDVLLNTASTESLIGTPEDYGRGRVDAKAAFEYLDKNGCM